jgi:ribosomal protein S18 acetylase RimI-like enzyme
MITALHIFDNKTLFSVTRYDGDEMVAGLIMIETDGWIRLTSVYVDPSHRYKGYGRDLVQEAINYKPSKKVYIEIDSFSDQTKNDGLKDAQLKIFYGSMGFKPVEPHPFAYVLEARI